MFKKNSIWSAPSRKKEFVSIFCKKFKSADFTVVYFRELYLKLRVCCVDKSLEGVSRRQPLNSRMCTWAPVRIVVVVHPEWWVGSGCRLLEEKDHFVLFSISTLCFGWIIVSTLSVWILELVYTGNKSDIFFVRKWHRHLSWQTIRSEKRNTTRISYDFQLKVERIKVFLTSHLDSHWFVGITERN